MSMLRQVLAAFKDTVQPLSLSQLARQLDVDQALVEDMIGYWVRKGKLRDSSLENSCASGGCGGCTVGAGSCPFVVEMPRRYELVTDDNPNTVSQPKGFIQIHDIR